MGVLGAIPFYIHPLGLNRPNAWMYTILNQLLPIILLFRFWKPSYKQTTFDLFKSALGLGLLFELILVALFIWSVCLGEIGIDWTLSGFKGWVEIQIGQQIESTQMPMPGIPTDFLTFSRWTLMVSFIMPWLIWWIFLPQELIWRGWVFENNHTVRSWMILSLYWTAWQLPQWLTEPDWHWGWWQNNGLLFLQQVLSTWLLGGVLLWVRHRTQSVMICALIFSIVTISQVWPVMLQAYSPSPFWLWIGWNGWWGCGLMGTLLIWQFYLEHHNLDGR